MAGSGLGAAELWAELWQTGSPNGYGAASRWLTARARLSSETRICVHAKLTLHMRIYRITASQAI